MYLFILGLVIGIWLGVAFVTWLWVDSLCK